MNRLISYFMNSSFYKNDFLYRRARIGVIITLVSILGTFLQLAQTISKQMWDIVVVTIICLIINVVSFIYFKYKGHIKLLGNGLCLSFLIVLTTSSLFHSGIYSMTLAWYIIIPILASLLISKRGSIVWTALSILSIALLYYLDVSGIMHEDFIKPEHRVPPASIFYNFFILLLIIFAIIWTYENEETILLKSLTSSNEEILTQNEELQQQQEEIMTVNDALETTLQELKFTTTRLNKSIQYAHSIQQVVLPKGNELDSFFQSHFCLYLPKDTVSGDFYWFCQINVNKAIFALADCTGHGVPGAFMSMIGNTLLHETIKIKGVIEPARILLNLNEGIRNVLKQEESKNSDGMDISVCLFEKSVSKKEYKITFAGAKSSVFYKKNNQIEQLIGNRLNIGGITNRQKEFTNQEVSLQAGEMIYFTSDGYIDQNNVERKRFGSNKFKELLSNIYELPIPEQNQAVILALQEYQKNEEQRDDISVIGIKL